MTTDTQAPAERAAALAAPAATAAISPWIVLAAAFAASAAAVMAQFSAPPIMPLIVSAFGVDFRQAGTLMSVFSLTGLVLSLPAGLILQRFGPLATGGVALVAVATGSVLGALAGDFGMLVATRVIQGVGVGLIGIVAPAVVAAIFPPARRGLPMGIWATWVPFGALLMYLVAPAVAHAGGWQMVWWAVAAVSVVCLAIYVVVISMAHVPAGHGPGSALAGLRAALSRADVWRLAAAFALFLAGSIAINTYLPTFLSKSRGLELAAASAITSTVLAGAIVGGVLAGALSDRVRSRRRVMVWSCVVVALVWPVAFSEVPLPILVPALFVIGLMAGSISSSVFALVPEAVGQPRLIGPGMASANFGQSAGLIVGPILFASVQAASSWQVGGFELTLLGLAAAAVASRIRVG